MVYCYFLDVFLGIYIYIIVFYEMEDRLDMLGSNSVETDDRL